MEQRDYIIILYDYYGSLLNDKQRSYFEDYYFNNLSLSEMSDNLGVSRNAIHKSLKNIYDKLLWYEECLKLYEKDKRLKEIVSRINDKGICDELENLFLR